MVNESLIYILTKGYLNINPMKALANQWTTIEIPTATGLASWVKNSEKITQGIGPKENKPSLTKTRHWSLRSLDLQMETSIKDLPKSQTHLPQKVLHLKVSRLFI